MNTIAIIGAGQIGSRHLQALKAVKRPLHINVVDPSEKSLQMAQRRYIEFPAIGEEHSVTYQTSFKQLPSELDIVIVATTSGVRRTVIENLLRKSKVTYLILEKLLFTKKIDYSYIQLHLDKHHIKTWVNCSMRTMPFYRDMKNKFKDSSIYYHVDGSLFGLITNAIHYIDHMAFLTDCYDFKIITDGLNRKHKDSKRRGFLEIDGTLQVNFLNGSKGIFTCYSEGTAPIIVEIMNITYRCISKETENKAYISELSNNWQWEELRSGILFQSTMTTKLVEDILDTGTCKLTPYTQSVKLHLQLLEPLRHFLNKHSQEKIYNFYPFT